MVTGSNSDSVSFVMLDVATPRVAVEAVTLLYGGSNPSDPKLASAAAGSSARLSPQSHRIALRQPTGFPQTPFPLTSPGSCRRWWR